MRNKIIILSPLLMSILYTAQAEDILKNEKVQKVILFRNAAQIESRISQTIEKGEHLIIIDELPNSLDESTVQISGEGNFTILSVESKTGKLEQKKRGKIYSTILDSIEFYTNLIEMDNIRKYAIDQEENLLIANKNLSSKQTMAVVDLEDMADMYRKRLPELKKESLRLHKLITSNTQKLEEFKMQLAERQSGKNNKQVWVRVSLTQAQNVKLILKYLVADASWTPMYDVRCEDIGEDIQFILKANVVQSTGVNWDNVDLVLSTGNPINYTTKPILNDWRLSLANNAVPMMIYDNIQPVYSKAASIENENTKAGGVMATVSEQVNNIQYNITKSFSISSDGDVKTIEIQRNATKASYRYVTVPKLDNNAYLMASMKEWDQVLFQSAEANIFLKGSFVTKTHIDPLNISDSLEISLGNDEGIKVERKLAKEFTSKKTFGSTKKYMQGYEITVRNSKTKSVKIDIVDQVPLSSDKDIEVKYIAEGANYDESTGKLTWTYTIAPAETKKMNLQVEVKYPKDKYLQGW